MSLFKKIRHEIETKSGMFQDTAFDAAFKEVIGLYQMSTPIRATYNLSSQTKKTSRRNHLTRKGGTGRIGKFLSRATMFLFFIAIILSFSVHTKDASEFMMLVKTKKDECIQDVIIPFLMYLRQKNPAKDSVGWMITKTFTRESLIPSLNGMYNKSILMLTGDIFLSGQLVSFITNIDKYLIAYFKKQATDRTEAANAIRRDMLQIEASSERAAPPIQPQVPAVGFTYNLPPGSKIISPVQLV